MIFFHSKERKIMDAKKERLIKYSSE